MEPTTEQALTLGNRHDSGASHARLTSGRPPLVLFATSHVYGRRADAGEVVDLSFQLAKILVELAAQHGAAKAAHLALPEYFGGRDELLSEFELDEDTPIVFFSLRAPEDHRYLKGADVSHYVDIENDSVGDHALGASLPKANLGVDELLGKFIEHCPVAPTFPIHKANGKMPLKHSLAIARLRIKLQQQRAEAVKSRSLLVLYPDHDELVRLGFLLDKVGHRFDLALNLLMVTADEEGTPNPLNELVDQLIDRHPGIARLETQDLDLHLLCTLRDMGFDLFSTGYRDRLLFETAICDMLAMKVATQNFDGTYDAERHRLWSVIRLDNVLA